MNQKAQKSNREVANRAPWVRTELGEVVRIRSGGTPDMSNPVYWRGDVPWLSAKDLKSFWLGDSQIKLSREGVNSGTRLAQPGTVLILVRGMTLLKDVPIGVATREITFNQDIKALEPIDGVDGAFLALYLLNEKQRLMGLVSHSGHGTGRLSTDILESFPLLLPPLEEQRRISALLTVWDQAIELTERLIAAKQRRMQALMLQLLTGKRRFKKWERLKWHKTTLGQVAEVRRGASPRPIEDPKWFSEHGPGWIRIADVTRAGKYLRHTKQCLSALGASKSVRVMPGSLIMSICATIGRPIIIDIEACIHDGFVFFDELTPEVDTEFLYYALLIETTGMERLGQPGTQRNLNTSIVKSRKLLLPPREEQKMIVDVLACCDREIDILCQKLDSLRIQKMGLMQQLLTGKTRVISP